MATRGAIGIRNEDGSVTGIYSHWDSYVIHNGRILLENYDHTKTQQLLELGSVSVLGPEIGDKHDFDESFKSDDPRYNWCKFYGRDRGEKDVGSKTFDSDQEFVSYFADCWSHYFYLLEECGTWFVKTRTSEWKRVDHVLEEESKINE